MHAIYQLGEPIPGFNGVIRGGTTIVIDDPEEVLGLQAICTLARLPGATPLQGVRLFLHAPFIDLDRWFQRPQQTETPAFPHWRNATSTDALDENDELVLILSLAHDIWKNQGGKEAGLCLAMAVGDFTSVADPVLELEGENTGLVFTPGSAFIATLLSVMEVGEKVAGVVGAVKFVAKAKRWVVGFFRGRGLVPSKRSDNLKEDLRKRALSANARSLIRLDQLTKQDLAGKKGVIILLHGLLSTDCGTFDRFIEAWEDDKDDWVVAAHFGVERECVAQTRNQDFLVVGWPHDTLTGVTDSGFELFRLLEDLAGAEGSKIAFVCHSRGGLVARNAATRLFAKSPGWQARLCGCVTFGTPHEGAGLAAVPNERFLGTFAAAMAANTTHSLLSLDDVFSYQEQRKGLPGIQDLRSPADGGEFLRVLQEQEHAQALPGRQRLLDIFAVGGHSPWTGSVSALADRVLGNSEHDLVVELQSSISRYLNETRRTECDHFGYFTAEEARKPHCREAVEYLKTKLEFAAAVWERCQKTAAGEGSLRITREEDQVNVGGIVVPTRKLE